MVRYPFITADAIEAQLTMAGSAGHLRFGLTRRGSAVVTRISPWVMRSAHVHFVDGADAGYARAVLQLKAEPT